MTTHFLRDSDNRIIADVEAFQDDIRCVIDIVNFTNFYDSLFGSAKREWVSDMANLQELRAIYHEEMCGSHTPDELARRVLDYLARKWSINYVVD